MPESNQFNGLRPLRRVSARPPVSSEKVRSAIPALSSRRQICCPRLARRAALVWLSLLQRRSDQTGLCLKVRPAWPARSVIWDCLWRVPWAQTTVTPFCHSGRLAYSAVRLGVGEPYHPMGEASTGRPQPAPCVPPAELLAPGVPQAWSSSSHRCLQPS